VKLCRIVFALVVSVSVPVFASPHVDAQSVKKTVQPIAKSAAEKSAAEKSVTEKSEIEKSQSAMSPKLRATIHHSESLPPLPAKYRAGAFYGAYGLPDPMGQKAPRVNVQFKVPDWLAGKWQRDSSVETKRVELPANKDLKPAGRTTTRSEDMFGTYRDKNGQIWQIFSSDHATGEVDRGAYIDKHTVTKYNLEVTGPTTAVVEVVAFHLIISKKQHRIVESYQDEEFNTYTLTPDGKLKTDSSVKVFDGDGVAKLLTRSASEVVRILRFDDMVRAAQPK